MRNRLSFRAVRKLGSDFHMFSGWDVTCRSGSSAEKETGIHGRRDGLFAGDTAGSD